MDTSKCGFLYGVQTTVDCLEENFFDQLGKVPIISTISGTGQVAIGLIGVVSCIALRVFTEMVRIVGATMLFHVTIDEITTSIQRLQKTSLDGILKGLFEITPVVGTIGLKAFLHQQALEKSLRRQLQQSGAALADLRQDLELKMKTVLEEKDQVEKHAVEVRDELKKELQKAQAALTEAEKLTSTNHDQRPGLATPPQECLCSSNPASPGIRQSQEDVGTSCSFDEISDLGAGSPLTELEIVPLPDSLEELLACVRYVAGKLAGIQHHMGRLASYRSHIISVKGLQTRIRLLEEKIEKVQHYMTHLASFPHEPPTLLT